MKGDKNINIYGYESFDENTNYANEADKIAAAKTESKLIATFAANGTFKAMPYDELPDAYKTVDAWVNEIDLTDYVKANAKADVHLLLAKANLSNESTKFYSKDLADDIVNAKDASLVFKKADLLPHLTLVYEKKSSTGISEVNAEKVVDDAYYNLQGVKMNPNNLPHGIYIHQGKKVVK